MDYCLLVCAALPCLPVFPPPGLARQQLSVVLPQPGAEAFCHRAHHFSAAWLLRSPSQALKPVGRPTDLYAAVGEVPLRTRNLAWRSNRAGGSWR